MVTSCDNDIAWPWLSNRFFCVQTTRLLNEVCTSVSILSYGIGLVVLTKSQKIFFPFSTNSFIIFCSLIPQIITDVIQLVKYGTKKKTWSIMFPWLNDSNTLWHWRDSSQVKMRVKAFCKALLIKYAKKILPRTPGSWLSTMPSIKTRLLLLNSNAVEISFNMQRSSMRFAFLLYFMDKFETLEEIRELRLRSNSFAFLQGLLRVHR